MVAPLRTMIHNRHLPLWLHRICNGVFSAALLIGIGSIWFGEPPGSWQHVLSGGLIWAGIPVGVAVLVRRLSIVEGVAGGDGYNEPNKADDQKPPA